MPGRPDVETALSAEEASNIYDSHGAETEALLPTSRPETDAIASPTKGKSDISFTQSCRQQKFSSIGVATAFVLGTVACLLAQYAICGTNCFKRYDQQLAAVHTQPKQDVVSVLASPWAGSTVVHKFPPTEPTNAFPSLFPSNVGYAGATPTGAEAAVVATAPAYPLQTGQCNHPLLRPVSIPADSSSLKDKKDSKFNLFRSWGNLSPWFSVEKGHFGVDSTAATPETCRVTGLHFLHRHGARYPTAWGQLFHPPASSFRLKMLFDI